MAREERERIEQIPDLGIIPAEQANVDESEVMVALLNMGGPRTNQEVCRFLKRVFCDPIIMRFPLSPILQPLFAWLLVTLRGKKTEQRYQLIGGGSPIFDSTRKQTQALQEELRKRGRKVDITFSFNYSVPFPEDTIAEIRSLGKKYILPLSLYPHYSKATTGSNLFYLKQAAQKLYPQVKFLESAPYYLHDGYIQGFVDRIYAQIESTESLDDFYLIFSAHGLPLYFLMEGDPYPFQICQTVSKILGKLNRRDRWVISYQSAVGPLKWLKPSTESIIDALASRGIKRVLIVPIAFVTDHIETLCEIDMEYRKLANDLGITDFRMSKALECYPAFITALADSVEASLPRKSVQVSHPQKILVP